MLLSDFRPFRTGLNLKRTSYLSRIPQVSNSWGHLFSHQGGSNGKSITTGHNFHKQVVLTNRAFNPSLRVGLATKAFM